jgi:hypothetical protein
MLEAYLDLFLGLDSRSAFVVMENLKRLTLSRTTTVAAVIHQPRTDIFAMFDSLFLLGVGGRTVYHGPGTECITYFKKLGFHLKEGDSQADFFLDISSGDVEPDIIAPDVHKGAGRYSSHSQRTNSTMFGSIDVFEFALRDPGLESGNRIVLRQSPGVERNFVIVEVPDHIQRARYSTATLTGDDENLPEVGDKVVAIDGKNINEITLWEAQDMLDNPEYEVVYLQLLRQDSDGSDEETSGDEQALIHVHDKPSNEDTSQLQARLNREKLYRQWNIYFENLTHRHRTKYYAAPRAYDLPTMPKAVSFLRQLQVQLLRNSLVSWRARTSRLLDFGVLIVAIFAMTLLAGAKTGSFDANPSQLVWFSFIQGRQEAAKSLVSDKITLMTSIL